MTIALAASGSVGLLLPAVFSANLALQLDLRGKLDVAAAGVLSLQAKLQAEIAAAATAQAEIGARIAAQAEVLADLQASLTASLEVQFTPPQLQVAAALEFAATAAADLAVAIEGPTFGLDLAAGIGELQAKVSAAVALVASLEGELTASLAAALQVQAAIQAEITAQLALVADLQAQLTIALGLGAFFGNAGVRLYTYDGNLEDFGAEASAYLGGVGADGMAGPVQGLLILTDIPSSFAALTTVLGV